MSDDADDIVVDTPKVKKSKPMKEHDNFIAMGLEGAKCFPWKKYLILLMIFLFITCNVFVDKCLSGFKGTVDGSDPTAYGTVIQGIFLVLVYIVFDFLVTNKYI